MQAFVIHQLKSYLILIIYRLYKNLELFSLVLETAFAPQEVTLVIWSGEQIDFHPRYKLRPFGLICSLKLSPFCCNLNSGPTQSFDSCWHKWSEIEMIVNILVATILVYTREYWSICVQFEFYLWILKTMWILLGRNILNREYRGKNNIY